MRLRPIRPKPPGYRAAQLVLVPVIAALLAVTGGVSSCRGEDHGSSDQRDTRKFSPRQVTVPESIQLSPCQRSAAACFESGGLGTLTNNLDGLSINHDTGRFCFEFQDGCERR